MAVLPARAVSLLEKALEHHDGHLKVHRVHRLFLVLLVRIAKPVETSCSHTVKNVDSSVGLMMKVYLLL